MAKSSGGSDINGLSNHDFPRLRGGEIGFVVEFFNLPHNLTAEENLEMAMMFS